MYHRASSRIVVYHRVYRASSRMIVYCCFSQLSFCQRLQKALSDVAMMDSALQECARHMEAVRGRHMMRAQEAKEPRRRSRSPKYVASAVYVRE